MAEPEKSAVILLEDDKYHPVFSEQVYKLCLLGLKQSEIAEFFCVDLDTIDLWKIRYIDFCDAINRGGTMADANVVESLYRRAVGYTTKKVKVTYDTKLQEHMVERYDEEVAGDVKAQIEWLSRRQREKWRAGNITIIPPAPIDEDAANTEERDLPVDQNDLFKWYLRFINKEVK